MNARLSLALENNPSIGWLVAVMNWLIATFTWLTQHADGLAKMFALGAALFGLIAGYYTMRIQRRAWRTGQARDKP